MAQFFDEVRRIAITAMFSDDWLFERVVLKGGNALHLVHEIGSRASMDLDFSLDQDDELDPDQIRDRAFAALKDRFDSAGYVVFDERFEPQPPGEDPQNPWGGFRLEFKLIGKERAKTLSGNLEEMRRNSEAIWEGQKKTFKIELSKNEYCGAKVERDFDDYAVRVYPPVMIAIEKIRAICQQMPEYRAVAGGHASSRARDFYDLCCLMDHGVILDAIENRELVEAVFDVKNVPLTLIGKVSESREFHRTTWPIVDDVVSERLEAFDVYFDRVVEATRGLEAFWVKDSPA